MNHNRALELARKLVNLVDEIDPEDIPNFEDELIAMQKVVDDFFLMLDNYKLDPDQALHDEADYRYEEARDRKAEQEWEYA